MNEHIKCFLPFLSLPYHSRYRYFLRYSKQISVTKAVKSYVIRWQSRARTGVLQLICPEFFGWPGQAAASSGAILPAPSPTLPLCSCIAEVARIEKHIALNAILSSVHTLLYPSYLQLSQPSTSKTWPKPAVEFILCISCSFQIHSKIKSPSFLFTWDVCHLETVPHSPFTTNGKCKCQARSHLSCDLTLVQTRS